MNETQTQEAPMTYRQHLEAARAYYALCAEAEALGIPTSLDDPRSPKTVDGLRAAVEAAR
jgi:hypothetical protein